MTDTSTALERFEEPRRATLAEKIRYAEQLATADLLPATYRKRPGNVLVAVEYGDMLGVHPLTAVSHIHVVEGKPTQSAELMRASVRKAGHRFRVIESTAERAEVQVVRCDDPEYPFTVVFDVADARRAGLVPAKPASSWTKYPTAMLLARATSACVRMACPEVLMGISYVPEELGADVDEDGNLLVTNVGAFRVSDEATATPSQRSTKEVIDEITALAATLTDAQRETLRAWREEQGITFVAERGGATYEQAMATLAQVIAVAGAPATPTSPVDDDVAEGEIVGGDEEVDPDPVPDPTVVDAEVVVATGPPPGVDPATGEIVTPAPEVKGTPKGAYFARHDRAAGLAGLSTGELRRRLVWIATSGQLVSAARWPDDDARWLELNRLLDEVIDEEARPVPVTSGDGWQMAYGVTDAA